jgi:hypothetical protein
VLIWFRSTSSQFGQGNLSLGDAVTGVAFGSASKYGQANASFSRRNSLFRGVFCRDLTLRNFESPSTSNDLGGRLQSPQASVTQVRPLAGRELPGCLSAIHTAVLRGSHTHSEKGKISDIVPYLSMLLLQYVATICAPKTRCRGLRPNP